MIQVAQLDTPEFRELAEQVGKPVWSTAKTSAGRKMAKFAWCGKDAEQFAKIVGPRLRLKKRNWLITQEFFRAREAGDLGWMLELKAQMIALNKVT